MTAGRRNQRQRTRKDLLRAASQLMQQGQHPGIEEIAATALVSRATAYRYFPNVDALLLEAALDVATPDAEDLFRDETSNDAVQRVGRVDAAFAQMIATHEPQVRLMLAKSLERSVGGGAGDDVPTRQNRRTPLIEAALEPAQQDFRPEDFKLLVRALAIVIGTEAHVVTRDVLRLSEREAATVRHWAIEALVAAARKHAPQR